MVLDEKHGVINSSILNVIASLILIILIFCIGCYVGGVTMQVVVVFFITTILTAACVVVVSLLVRKKFLHRKLGLLGLGTCGLILSFFATILSIYIGGIVARSVLGSLPEDLGLAIVVGFFYLFVFLLNLVLSLFLLRN